MIKKRLIVAGMLGFALLVLMGIVFIWYVYFFNKKAAIFIETVPEATVFINGSEVGTTPFEGEFTENEVDLKLVPNSYGSPLVPYETRILLTKGVKTIVRRIFGEEEETSYGEEISFERLGGKLISISVISIPDGAKVFIDGGFVDTTPVKLSSDVKVGEHRIMIQTEGFENKEVLVQTVTGYGVLLIADLSKKQSEDLSDDQGVDNQDGLSPALVEILDTPVGYLRVRSEGATASAEIDKVKPGEKYELIEEKDQWLKIKLDNDIEGWIFSDYASISAKSQ